VGRTSSYNFLCKNTKGDSPDEEVLTAKLKEKGKNRRRIVEDTRGLTSVIIHSGEMSTERM
jgi:hypothetical protein